MGSYTITNAPNGARTVSTLASTHSIPLSGDYYATLGNVQQWITGQNVVPISRYSGDLNAAITALDVAGNSGKSFTLVIDCATTMSASVDLSGLTHLTAVHLEFLRGGIITFGAYDLTIRNAIPLDVDWQIFNYDSTGILKTDIFNRGGPRFLGVRPEWWFTPTWDGTDATAAIQAAVDFAVQLEEYSTHYGVVQFACAYYLISSAISVPDGKSVCFNGAGVDQTFIVQGTVDTDIIQAHHTVFSDEGGRISNLTLRSSDVATTGIAISLKNQNRYYIENVRLWKVGTGLKNDCCGHVVTKNMYCQYFAYNAIYVTGSTAGANYYSQVKISNVGYAEMGGTVTGTVGIYIEQTGHETLSDVEVLGADIGMKIVPVASGYINFIWCSNVVLDSNNVNGLYINESSGYVNSLSFNNCWASWSGEDGIKIVGDIDEFIWNGGRVRENGMHGINIDGGQNILISNSMISSNSRLYDNTYHGIDVAANISKFQINSNRIGNFCSSGDWSQAHGINIATGTGDYFMVNNNILTDAGSGKSGISFTPTGGYDHYLIEDNVT